MDKAATMMRGGVKRIVPTRATRGPPERLGQPVPGQDPVPQTVTANKVRKVAASNLFDTTELPTPIDKEVYGEVAEAAALAALRRTSPLVMPHRPAAPTLAHGEEGDTFQVVLTEHGEPYEIGDLGWAVFEELCDERAQALMQGQPPPRLKRRDGQKFWAGMLITEIKRNPAINATRQNPEITGQALLTFDMMLEYQMLPDPSIIPVKWRRGAWFIAKGWMFPTTLASLGGHIKPEMLGDTPHPEGALIPGSVDLEVHENGQMVVVAMHERSVGEPFVTLREEEANMAPGQGYG